MNLVHHLIVADRLLDCLGASRFPRGPMLLGALTPDAHSLRPGLGRACVHPPDGDDHVGFVVGALEPADALRSADGRAFALGCICHLVADELTRSNRYHLPPYAPTGFMEVPHAARPLPRRIFDVPRTARTLMRARAEHWLRPLSPELIDGKRWETLGRYPLCSGRDLMIIVEPLATVAVHCALETLRRIHASPHVAALLGAEPGRRARAGSEPRHVPSNTPWARRPELECST